MSLVVVSVGLASVSRRWASSTLGPKALPGTTRVFGISDIHTDRKENRERLAHLPVGPFSQDVLLVAGDVSHDENIFSDTMGLLRERFGQVLYVPGNHDLWVSGSRMEDSLAKHWWLMQTCEKLGVSTCPIRFPEEKLIIVPLFSWYHQEFDTEPDLPQEALPRGCSAAARRRQRKAVLGDELSCRWPEDLGSSAGERNQRLAKLFDELNDAPGAAASPAPDGAQQLSFAEAVARRSQGETVISFSHFLPASELFPEKRFLYFPQLAEAVGSLPLQARVKRLRPALHLFGHTHFAWDAVVDGVRYLQAPLGSPRERRFRPQSLHLEGGVPSLLWRGSASTQPLPAARSALWSDYYALHERRPSSCELGHWIRIPFHQARRRSPPSSQRAAVLWLVFGIDEDPGDDLFSVLAADEQHRADCLSGAPRQSFVTMRAALRCILGQQLGIPPSKLEFSLGEHGKPHLKAPALAHRCSFNVTHSGSLGAVLVFTQPWGLEDPAPAVGVDIERHRERCFAKLARRFFLPSESTAIEEAMALEPRSAEDLFFGMWTKKEAWLKARGIGIRGGLHVLDCSGGKEVACALDPALDDTSTSRRQYIVSAPQDLSVPGHSIAVALPRDMPLRFASLSEVGWPHFLRSNSPSGHIPRSALPKAQVPGAGHSVPPWEAVPTPDTWLRSAAAKVFARQLDEATVRRIWKRFPNFKGEVPESALFWSEGDLERFFASGGQLKPCEVAEPGGQTCSLLHRLRLELASSGVSKATSEYRSFSRHLEAVNFENIQEQPDLPPQVRTLPSTAGCSEVPRAAKAPRVPREPVVIPWEPGRKDKADGWNLDFWRSNHGDWLWTCRARPLAFEGDGSQGPEVVSVQASVAEYVEYARVLAEEDPTCDEEAAMAYFRVSFDAWPAFTQCMYPHFENSWKELAPPGLEDLTLRWLQMCADRIRIDWLQFLARFYRVSLYAPGSVTRLHTENFGAHTWISQTEGRRLFFLFSPKQVDKLYMAAGSRVDCKEGHIRVASPLDVFAPNLKRYPRFAEAAAQTALLSPGETLIIPSGWWWVSAALEPCVSISRTFYNSSNHKFFCQELEDIMLQYGELAPNSLDSYAEVLAGLQEEIAEDTEDWGLVVTEGGS